MTKPNGAHERHSTEEKKGEKYQRIKLAHGCPHLTEFGIRTARPSSFLTREDLFVEINLPDSRALCKGWQGVLVGRWRSRGHNFESTIVSNRIIGVDFDVWVKCHTLRVLLDRPSFKSVISSPAACVREPRVCYEGMIK
jgi:hypothetical protein